MSPLVAALSALVSVLPKVRFLSRENIVATLHPIGLSVMLWIQFAWLLASRIPV